MNNCRSRSQITLPSGILRLYFEIPRIPLMEKLVGEEQAVPMATDDAEDTAEAEVYCQ